MSEMDLPEKPRPELASTPSNTPAGDPVRTIRDALVQALANVASASAAPVGPAGVTPRVEAPKRAGQGDYATNAAMQLAPSVGAPPREVAERIGESLTELLGPQLAEFEIAGPGFLNLTLTDAWYRDALRVMLDSGSGFGSGGTEHPEKISLEFVSANPTAELVAASGRHAAYGDSLRRILEHHGHEVSPEYYFNDAGGQIHRLGESVRARALDQPAPEDGYQGEYVADLASQIPGAADPSVDVDEIAAAAVEILLAKIKATLARYGVKFDTYFSERVLHTGSPSAIERALDRVRESGALYEHDGATWVRTTDFGDEKDRPVLRSDGRPTYFAADVAYMANKKERGFERQIVPVGSDHHGYVARMKAAFAALGNDPDLLELPLIQFMHLVEGEQRAAMSKRRGEFVTLDDLLDQIGVDATRFFMLQSSQDRTLDLNVDLAKSQSAQNPVYYVQYAHARIASLLAKAGPERCAAALAEGADWGSPAGDPLQPVSESATIPLEPSERELLRKLLALPEEIAEAADRRAPHRIAVYALELAQTFTAFYDKCKVVGAEPESVESFRLALCQATRTTLALVLDLLGVSAPNEM